VVANALAPGPLEEAGIDNPLSLAGSAGKVAAVLAIVGILLHWLSLPPAAVCVVLRFRSSRGVERQQLRWVAAGVAAAVAGLLISLPGGLGFAPGWISNLVFPALLCPPVAVAVAVLRYRLYDLDRVVSRTLTYALLTVLLGLGYAAVVLGLGRLLPEGSSLAVAAATLAAAAAFSPVRRRVQAAVDRRFNRRRYDATGTVEAFAARLRDQVDLDALHTELLAVVDQTVQPTRASLWLRGAPWSPTGSGRRGRRLCSGPAPSRARPPSRCSRRRPAEVKGTSSSRDAGRVPSSRGRRERGSRGRRLQRSTR
jgi:hypothetical protein